MGSQVGDTFVYRKLTFGERKVYIRRVAERYCTVLAIPT